MAVTVNLFQAYRLHTMGSVQSVQINHAAASAGDFKVVLLSPSYTFDSTHSTQSQLTNEISAANYTVGGINLGGVTLTVATSGTATFDANDVLVTASGTDMSARSAVLVWAAAGASALMCQVDFGQTETAGNGTTFNIVWNAAGIIQGK